MPIFMDRHNLPEGTTHKDVTGAHHADMQTQDKYDVKFLTYWFDQGAGGVFCLADAPDAEALNKVHGESHGDIPNEIIEVDLSEVELFMGDLSKPIEDATGTLIANHPLRTILFTDLQDSTDMITSFGDAEAIRLFEIHDKIIREAIAKYHGREIKNMGDGFLIVFDDVSDAIKSAVEIQQRFEDYNTKAPSKPLNVRIGLNAGQPVQRGGDLFGMVVNLASRFCDHAEPGQILSSGVIYQLLKAEPDLQELFHERGKAYFKGFPNAMQIYEVKRGE